MNILVGSLVKFATPMADENPNQIYRVINLDEGSERCPAMADIEAQDTGMTFPPISTVELSQIIPV